MGTTRDAGLSNGPPRSTEDELLNTPLKMPLPAPTPEQLEAARERARKWEAMTPDERRAYSKELEAERQAKRKASAERYAAWKAEQKTKHEGRRKDLERELKALLAKYGASISASVGAGSDTHGIYDESIEVSMLVDAYPGHTGRDEITAIEVTGWSISASDLKDK